MMRAVAPRLSDIVQASVRVRTLLDGITLEAYEADWHLQWICERGVAIISEASRHLPEDLKGRHAEIPWRLIAGIGNILRHDYGNISGPVIWKVINTDLLPLEAVCRQELSTAVRLEGFDDDGLGA